MRRRLVYLVVAAIALGAVLVLLIHAPFVRMGVLRYALATIADQYGIRVEAARLDYNLWSLRAGLAGVRVSAVGKQPPFFEAAYIAVTVPRRTLFGDLFFDDITVTDGVVRVERTPAGDNLPAAEGTDAEEPAALPIGRLALSPLRIEVRDDTAGLAFEAPAAVVELAADEGRIALTQPATVTFGDRQTSIAALDGGARFDGRTLRLVDAAVQADEGRFTVDGTIALIASEPSLDLRVAGQATVARLARWGMAEADAPRGELTFAGRVSGPLNTPTAEVEAAVPRLEWSDIVLTNATARARVAPDAAMVDRFAFDIAGGQVAGSASFPFGEASAMTRLRAEADIQLQNQPPPFVPIALPGRSRLDVADGVWRLEGRHCLGNATPATIALRGRLADDLLQSTVAGRVRVPDADVTALAAVLREADLVDLPPESVPAGRVRADAQVTGTFARPRVAFAAASDELRMATPAASGALSVTGTFDGGTERYAFDASLPGWSIAPTADVPLTARVDAAIRGSGRSAAITGQGQVTAREVTWDTVAVGEIDATVDLGPQLAHVVAQAPQFNAAADARIATTAPYAASMTARVDRLNLARVLAAVDTPVPLAGVTSAVLRAEGSLEEWRAGAADLEVTAFDATVGEVPLRLLPPALVRYRGGRLLVDRFEAEAGETHIAAVGEIAAFEPGARSPEPGAGVIATITGDVGEVARTVAATGLTEVPVTGGRGPVALLARIAGSLEAPLVSADLEVGPGEIALTDLPSITGLRLRTHVENGWAELRDAHGVYQGATIEGTGRLPLSLLGLDVAGAAPGDASLRARATGITAAVLEPFIEASASQEIAGSIDATLALDSPSLDAAAVRGELVLDRLDVRIADLPVTQRTPTRIVVQDGFARIAAWDWTGQGATLGVQGQVRLDNLQAAILANGEVDLRMATPFVRQAGVTTGGRLRPRVSITGVLTDPRVDGDVLIDGAELRLADPRVIVADLNGRAILTRSTATLTATTGSINGGALTAQGSAELLPDSSATARLTTTIDGMALEFPQGLRSELDASLLFTASTAAGDAVPTGRLEGTITVLRGSYREPMAVVTGLLANVQAASLASAVEAPDALNRLLLDVRLVTDEDLVMDNNYGRLELGADLRLIGTAAAPALSGRAVLREGGQLFVGQNTYAIESGSIDFANPATIEPNLNLQLMTRAGGVDIEVAITGTPDTMSVALSAPNASEDIGEADLTALLVTGRRLDELNTEDAALIGAQVLGNLSADVLGFAGRALGLDTLRIGGVQTTGALVDPALVATELDPTSRLTFGKALGPNVDVTFSQSLRDGDAQTWIVDYLPSRQIELRLISNDEDLRSLGFRHDLSFGGGRRDDRPAPRPRMDLRVTAVRFSGDLVVPEEQLREAISLEPDDDFDFVEWQRDRDRLLGMYQAQRYLTARITASRTAADGGVALGYAVAPGPRTAIVVRGAELSAATMAELRNAWADVAYEAFLIDEATAVVRRALAADGFLQPQVTARLDQADGTTTLTIDAAPGTQTASVTIRLDGVDDTLAAELTSVIEARGLTDIAVTNPSAVEQALAGHLRGQGFLRANVRAGARLVEGETAIVPITIAAGNPIVVGSVAFEGVMRLPIEEVREAAELPLGVPADPAAVETARDRTLAFYRFEGFARAAVTARQSLRDGEPLLDVTFTVVEGPRQVLSEVAVSGNRSIDPDVIERALEAPLGEPLGPNEWLQARSRVFATGLFRRVDVIAEPIEQAAASDGTLPMRMRVIVEEWPILRARYGLQVAEERPEENVEGRDLVPGIAADVTRRTLFGRAITIGAATTIQRRERSMRAFVTAPTLAGQPIETSVTAEHLRDEIGDSSRIDTRRGVALEQRLRFVPRLRLSYGYRFEHSRTDLPPDPVIGPLPPIEVDVARVTSAAAWDTRDDPVDTSRGMLLSTSFELAATRLGSDIAYGRWLTQAYVFRPWRNVVFASAVRFGTVRPLGDQELLGSFHFFAGGARTVRGVEEDGLGERDFFGDPRGGQGLLVLNQEVRFPIHRWLRGVGFVDAGSISPEPTLAFGDLETSVGFGLRLSTPFGVLRTDYGRVIAPGPEHSESGRWTFGIGQAF